MKTTLLRMNLKQTGAMFQRMMNFIDTHTPIAMTVTGRRRKSPKKMERLKFIFPTATEIAALIKPRRPRVKP